jgi:hypothetical protein
MPRPLDEYAFLVKNKEELPKAKRFENPEKQTERPITIIKPVAVELTQAKPLQNKAARKTTRGLGGKGSKKSSVASN